MTSRPVLYAEDEADDAFFLQRAFIRAQVEQKLIVMPDGQEAIDYLSGNGAYTNREEHPLPCLLLLDLNMPRKSGWEVLNCVRTDPRISTLPVIVLTSSLHDADLQRAYNQGANAYLVKPSNPEELLLTVKSIKDFWLTRNRSPENTWNILAADDLRR